MKRPEGYIKRRVRNCESWERRMRFPPFCAAKFFNPAAMAPVSHRYPLPQPRPWHPAPAGLGGSKLLQQGSQDPLRGKDGFSEHECSFAVGGIVRLDGLDAGNRLLRIPEWQESGLCR